MADPLLIPAYPQVLAPGLLILFGGVPHVVTFVWPEGHHAKGWNANAVNVDTESVEHGTETGPLWREHTRLNLRIPAVRDAVVRAIVRDENEGDPVSVHFYPLDETDNTPPRWVWAVGDFFFSSVPVRNWVDFVVPALADIDPTNPDRNLLALAAIAAHVLGGSNG